jgi:hypothetical protein
MNKNNADFKEKLGLSVLDFHYYSSPICIYQMHPLLTPVKQNANMFTETVLEITTCSFTKAMKYKG